MLAFSAVAGTAEAQQIGNAFSSLPGSGNETGTSQPAQADQAVDGEPGGDGTADPLLLAGSRKTPALDAEAEPLNPRTTPIEGIEESATSTREDLLGRDNLRQNPIDGLRPRLPLASTDSPGIRLGTFVLRPSITTSVGNETTRSAGDSVSRSYGQTELKGTLTSDWSRHQLTITGDGTWQRNFAGEGQTDPSARIDADLRLDLPADAVAHLSGGYALGRESATDPNAVLGAIDQSAVQTLSAGASFEREFGRLRGLAAVDLARITYGDVTLSDGSRVSLSERDRDEGELRLRLGYELSPALVPYLEASLGRTLFDSDLDALGYDRDAKSLGGKAGVEVDLGEKLKGDLGLGYRRVTFADARLAAIDAVVLDAAVNWSPRRGTDISLGLATTVEPSFEGGQSGYVNRALTLALTQEVRANLVARLTGGLTWRSYKPDGTSADELVSTIGTGFTYGINRYLDLTGDVSWERTKPDGGAHSDVLRAGLGLTLKR